MLIISEASGMLILPGGDGGHFPGVSVILSVGDVEDVFWAGSCSVNGNGDPNIKDGVMRLVDRRKGQNIMSETRRSAEVPPM